MELTVIINQLGLMTANLLLTIAFIFLTFKKIEDKEQVKIPMVPLIFIFIYATIYLISFIGIGQINILFVLFYVIIFICIIILILLNVDNSSVLNKLKENMIKLLRR